MIQTREEVLEIGLEYPDTYLDTPFSDDNWVLVRVKGIKKAFLWTFEKDGFMCLNLKTSEDTRGMWQGCYIWKSGRDGW